MANGRQLIAIALGLLIGRCCGAAPASNVVIVYNDQQPEGQGLAEYYAAKRDVPTNQICRISVRPAETITRKEFNEEIRRPIARFFTEQGLWKQVVRSGPGLSLMDVAGVEMVENRIWYLVLIYGVPVRIERDPGLNEAVVEQELPAPMRRNEAAVDSELALLPSPGLPLIGPVGNPFFNAASWHFGPPLNRQMILAGRLDGPDPQIIRRMIDDAVATERHGLLGRAYFDIRSITDPGYVAGDQWIRRAYDAFVRAGYECYLDEKPETIPESFPMPDAAVYAGWYAPNVVGPFQRKDFRFRPGAIAYHLHSASAADIRSRGAYWVGPLLAKGADVTMGNVYEPYLTMTPHVDRFFKALLEGATFLEAAYHSQVALSWQTTFVGDPLYRPFKLSVKEQIAVLESEKSPDLPWAYLREVRLLAAGGKVAEARQLCHEKAEQLGSDLLRQVDRELSQPDQKNK